MTLDMLLGVVIDSVALTISSGVADVFLSDSSPITYGRTPPSSLHVHAAQ